VLPVLIGHFVPHTQRHKRAESIHYFFGCCCCCCSYIPLSLVLIMITFNVLSFLRLGMCFLIWICEALHSCLLYRCAHTEHRTRSLLYYLLPMWLFEMLHIIFSGICEFWLHRKKNREEWNDKTRTAVKSDKIISRFFFFAGRLVRFFN
jgi:hypothetical protein